MVKRQTIKNKTTPKKFYFEWEKKIRTQMGNKNELGNVEMLQGDQIWRNFAT